MTVDQARDDYTEATRRLYAAQDALHAAQAEYEKAWPAYVLAWTEINRLSDEVEDFAPKDPGFR